MSTKRKIYSAEFKAKIVLEVLEGNETHLAFQNQELRLVV